MARLAWAIVALLGCTPAPPAADPAPAKPAPFQISGDPLEVTEPASLVDYLPTVLDGVTATDRVTRPPTAPRASWQIDGRTVRVALGRIDDVTGTRASFELLGKDVTARMHGHELRGLRTQGNPAELSRDLSPPHRATLSVVAANAYLVTISVEPSEALDEPLAVADKLDIGGMTRLAVKEYKAKGDAP